MRTWNQNELDFLRENNHLPNNELSIILNRSIESIKTKKKKLGIKKQRVVSTIVAYNGLRLVDKPFYLLVKGIKRLFGVFRCECGRMVERRVDNVIFGNTKTCGNCKGRKC